LAFPLSLSLSLFTEGVTGCPPPNFKFSRPKSNSLTTEQPFISFETTQLYLPQTFTTSDVELVEGKVGGRDNTQSLDEQVDRNMKKDTSKVKENPFWFEDIIKDAEEHYSQPESFSSHLQQHHHHRNQRAKRNHHKKTLSVIHFDDDDVDKISRIEEMEEKMLAKRSAEFGEEDYPQNEVFSASEVVGNIYNANDTLAAFAAKNGKNKQKI
jgi:hypothetical protein